MQGPHGIRMIRSVGLGSLEKVIVQEFDSSQSALMGLEALVAEKLKAGFIESTVFSSSEPRQNPRNLPAPELASATPTHIVKARFFETPKDRWHKVCANACIFESTFTGTAMLAVNYSVEYTYSSLSKTDTRFAISYANLTLATKALDGLKTNNDLINFVKSAEIKVLDSVLNEKSDLDSVAAKEAFVTNFTNLDNSQTVIQNTDYDSSTNKAFDQVVTDVHALLLKNEDTFESPRGNQIYQSFGIASIRWIAEMVAQDQIVDTWDQARRKDGTIDFSKVSPESSFLYAFARSANHSYGYWVYVKLIIKALEKSGKHAVVLAALYISIESNRNHEFNAPNLGDSGDLRKIYGGGGPSPQTYRYMQRRARRYLSDLQHRDIDSYAKLMLSMLSFVLPDGWWMRSLTSKQWILAELLYGNVWEDRSHGRQIYLPSLKMLTNEVHIPQHIESKLISHLTWVTRIFESSKSDDVVSFTFQLLDRARVEVPINMNKERLSVLMKASNIKLRSDVQKFLEQDLNRFIELFGSDSRSYVDYCSQPNAKIAELLKLLMAKKIHSSTISAVISSLVTIDIEELNAILRELKQESDWQDSYIPVEVRIRLLASNFDRTISIYGEEITRLTDGRHFFGAWIDALHATPIEKMSTKDIFSVLNLVSANLRKQLSYAIASDLVRAISQGLEFDNLTRLVIAYSSKLKDPNEQLQVAGLLASLIKSEADFVWMLKWVDEFNIQNVLSNLPEVDESDLPSIEAIKVQICQYLESPEIFDVASTNNLKLGNLIELARAFGADGFFENLGSSSRNRTLFVNNLTSELIRSDSEVVVSVLQVCETELNAAASKNVQILFDLTSSPFMSIQQLGLDAISKLGLQGKTWIRLVESQLPLSISFVENYISTLSGSHFEDAIMVCLDSSVQAAREVGLSLLQSHAERINVDSIYVKLAETTDPHLAALVAARALQPGIPDESALDLFDSRLFKAVRQGRKAKNLVKERRIELARSGSLVSPEFQVMVDDLAIYGNEQDRDWAIELQSFANYVETSERALKLLEGDA